MSSIDSLLQYYADRLIVQYVTQPRARATIQIYAKQILIDNLSDQLQQAFGVLTAVGPQLDIIGKYVGIPRNISVPDDSPPYFGFQSSNSETGNLNGLTSSTNAGINAQAIFFQSEFYGRINVALSDDAYRYMIALQIILNHNDGTLASIQQLLWDIFGGAIQLTDNRNMTMTYTFLRKLPAGVPASVLALYLPRPMGVGIDVYTLTATLSPTTSSVIKIHPPWSSLTVESGLITATPTDGTGPYTYQWLLVTYVGTVPINLYASSPLTAATTIKIDYGAYPPPDRTNVSTWKCRVTDSLGHIADTDNVVVTLNIISPP